VIAKEFVRYSANFFRAHERAGGQPPEAAAVGLGVVVTVGGTDTDVADALGEADDGDTLGVLVDVIVDVGVGVDEADDPVAEGEVDADGLADGDVGVTARAGCPRTGPAICGVTGTLPGTTSARTIAAAAPAKASPPAANVMRRRAPERRNSVLRRARRSAGKAARWAASEFSGALA
jgi:hypothetical protein